MNITNTTIKHKRFSEYGWTTRAADGSLINTLSQGEIGVLLADNLADVLQVRIGIKDKSSFFEGLLLGSITIPEVAIKQYWETSQRPIIGNEHTLYINKKTNAAYRWDDTDKKYYQVSSAPGQGDGWWKEINGGKANLNIDSLGTSEAINW